MLKAPFVKCFFISIPLNEISISRADGVAYHSIWYMTIELVSIESALRHVTGVYYCLHKYAILDLSIFFKANYPVIFAQIIQ